MYKPIKKELIIVQLMLGISLTFGVFPPLFMFLFTRKRNIFYHETSRKALNFHLTIFPFFLINYFLPNQYRFIIYIVLVIELAAILNVMIRIASHKSYSYFIAIPYIKRKGNEVEKEYFDVK
ncbi:DUF4870 domain-containing protein [Metabacillus fastidiosus]|uniref:DUF4870 domain-containing protein n=1 Tax=Metabacillus fastidiosus TaxID=1458 RepID=UPI002E1D92F6|nr:DUF4870 domain-containing protein [Metabacillus fastidiosus]